MVIDAGLHESQDAPEASFGNCTGLLDSFDFPVRLDDPQPVHQPRQALIIVQWIPRLAILDKPGVACFHLDDGAFVLVGIEVNMLALAHQPVQ